MLSFQIACVLFLLGDAFAAIAVVRDDDVDLHNDGHVCAADRAKFCPRARSLVAVLACLEAHHDDLSPACKQAAEHCPAFKCAEDASKFCPDASNRHELVACLWKHRKELSYACENANAAHEVAPDVTVLSSAHPCYGDARRVCARAGDKLVAAMACLKENRATLSGRCARAVAVCPMFSCVDAAQTHCPDVGTHDALMACIDVHAPSCMGSDQHAPPKQPAAADDHDNDDAELFGKLCRDDRDRVCPKSAGRADLAMCFMAHLDDVDDECKAVVEGSDEWRCVRRVADLACPTGDAACLTEHRARIAGVCRQDDDDDDDDAVQTATAEQDDEMLADIDSNHRLSVAITLGVTGIVLASVAVAAYWVSKMKSIDTVQAASAAPAEYVRI